MRLCGSWWSRGLFRWRCDDARVDASANAPTSSDANVDAGPPHLRQHLLFSNGAEQPDVLTRFDGNSAEYFAWQEIKEPHNQARQ